LSAPTFFKRTTQSFYVTRRHKSTKWNCTASGV